MLLDRRIFLKSLGVIGGSTLVSCNTMAPKEKLTAYLTPPKEMVPGIAAYYATVCRACPAGCGILVKTREGRPIKLEGNPAHPVNRGKLCARGQAFVQELYSAYRVQQPRLGQGGRAAPVSWKQAVEAVAQKLKAGASVGFITGLESSTFDGLVRDFGRAYPRFEHVVVEPYALSSMAEASYRLFGRREVPHITLAHADFVLSLGADLLDTWVSPVEFSRQWAARHGMAAGRLMEMVYAGPRRNLTATAADKWIPVAPGRIAGIAHGVLLGVFEKKKGVFGADAAKIAGAIKTLTPAVKLDDADKGIVSGLTKRLLASKTPVVLTGGADVTGEDATVLHGIVLLLNHLVGAMGTALVYGDAFALSRVSPEKRALQLVERAVRGEVDVLFVHGADPVYGLPGGDALRKAKYVVTLAHTHTDTTDLAHAVLPVHHPLESWGDYDVTGSRMGLMQPVRTPLFNSKHPGDLLVELAEAAGKPLNVKDYKTYLVASWTARVGVTPEPAPRTAPLPDADAGVPEAVNFLEASDILRP